MTMTEEPGVTNATGDRSIVSRRARRLAFRCGVAALAAVLVGCGSTNSNSTAPSDDSSAAPTGTLRTFTYLDTVSKDLLGPFKAANPGLDVETATFDSNDEASAKIQVGFSTDVIEVCLDEAGPLVKADMLAPIDISRLISWDSLDPKFRDVKGITVNGSVIMVPTSAGAQGLIYDKTAFPQGVDSFAELFDSAYAGRVALDGGYWLTPMAITALAHGNTNPMQLSDDQVTSVKDLLLNNQHQFRAFARSDADMANLFKSGEIVLSDGNRAVAQSINDSGGNVGWAAPKEGVLSWICGLGISSDAKNVNAAYAFMNYYTSPEAQVIYGDLGYVMMNPAAVPDVDPKFRESADPSALKGAIAETQPANFKLWQQAWQEVKAG